MLLTEIIYSTVANKCPRCHQGKLFVQSNPYRYSVMLAMEKTCSQCGEVYENEQGYFFGALYVFYALTTGGFIVWLVLYNFVFNRSTSFFIGFMAMTILLLSPVIFRWSRIIWMNFFVRYNKEKDVKQRGKSLPSDLNL